MGCWLASSATPFRSLCCLRRDPRPTPLGGTLHFSWIPLPDGVGATDLDEGAPRNYSPLRDYSGVIRRNATRYLVPGAILLQVVGEVEGPLDAIDSFFGAV